MSRTATAGQLTAPSRRIFVTLIKQSDGTTKPVMSSQPLCDQSFHADSEANGASLFLLMGWCLQNNNVLDQSLLMRLVAKILTAYEMPHDVWGEILGFSSGFSQHDQNPLASLGNYAIAIKRPPSLFQAIKMNPCFIVDAVMRGQEDIVMNILQADPSYLLKTEKVKNSVGIEYEVTPLQAAIIANDVQMIEKMQKHFALLTTDLNGEPIDGIAEMHQQIKTIYTKSLNHYVDIQKAILKEQEAKISELLQLPTLDAAQTIQYDEIAEQIKQATKRIIDYKAALEKDKINEIIEAHNQAQEHNTFDFDPYVNAILSASPAELDVVMELINAKTPEETAAVVARNGVAEKQSDAARLKSFDKLTLVEKLNRFREELVKHAQQEIIFNPNHILAGLESNETAWDTLTTATDPGCKKRSIIFNQLAGWAQRNADEPIRQDVRQGTWYLTEKNEPRTRQSRFNEYRNGDIVRNSLVDVAVVNSSLVDGLGYKFAGGGCALAGRSTRRGWSLFQDLCRAKTTSLENLLLRPRNHISLTIA